MRASRTMRPPRWRPVAGVPLLLAALALGVGACGTADVIPPSFDTPPGDKMTAEERSLGLEVLGLVNGMRQEAGLPALAWDEAAADVGYDHAVDMRLRDYYDHINPDGLTPVDRMERSDVVMDYFVAENIARHNPDAQDVVDAWMNSEGHRQAILSSSPTHLGVGVHTGRGGPWWAQEFFARFED